MSDTAVFGLGYFGKFHAKDHASFGRLAFAVDRDMKKRKIAEDLGAEFLFPGPSKNLIIKRDKFGNPISHIIKKSSFIQKLDKTANWDIVTPPRDHFPLMLLGLELGKNIFVEKPPVERVSEAQYILERFPKSKIGVDYIEMAHPVVIAIKKEMARIKFQPFYFFHRRSKNLIEEKKNFGRRAGLDIVSEELTHDLSEIDFFRSNILKKSFKQDSPGVFVSKIERWEDLGYFYSANVRAEFSLEFIDGSEAKIKGGFLDQEVRQFAVVNREWSMAFYGNTLTRTWIKPAAAALEGRKNIDFLMEAIAKSKILNQEKQQEILEKVQAKLTGLGSYKPPLLTMIENFYQAESKKDLICPLDKALEYQRIAEEAGRWS